MGYYAENPYSGRAAVRLGHYAPALLSVSILGVIAVGLYPLPGPLLLTVPLALLVVVVMSWLMMRQHDRQLCEQCVASMPLNPAELAARLKRRFWLAHTGMQRRFLVPYLVVLIGSNFATGTAVGKLGWALIQLSMVYLIVSHSTHRRLQPWCPWCKEGGGGQEREDVTPPTSPVDRRQPV